MEEERGNQWACRGGRGESDSLTHTLPQNSQYWPEQLWTEQVSFLLHAPAKASHGATCDRQHQQQSTLCWDSASTGAPTAGLTARHNQLGRHKKGNTHMHTHRHALCTHTTLVVSNCECIMKLLQHRHKEIYLYSVMRFTMYPGGKCLVGAWCITQASF